MALVLDKSFSTPATEGPYSLRYNTGNQLEGVTFIPTISARVGRLSFKLGKVGSPEATVFAKVYDFSSGTGLPVNDLGSSAEVNCSSVVSGNWQDFDFTSGPLLKKGTIYVAVITGSYTLSTSNYISVYTDTTATTYSGVSGVCGGSGWYGFTDALGLDFQFKEYYDDTTIVREEGSPMMFGGGVTIA